MNMATQTMNVGMSMGTFSPETNITTTAAVKQVVYPVSAPLWKLIIVYVISISILVVNIPVFLLVPRRVPSLTCSMRYTMLSLALTDTLLGLLSLIRLIYFEASHRYYLHKDGFMCRWDGYLTFCFTSVSILCFLCLSVDKLLTIKYLLRYTVIMTRQKVLGAVAVVWLLVLTVYLPCLLGKEAGFDPSAYACYIVPQGPVHHVALLILFQILQDGLVLPTAFSTLSSTYLH